MLKAVSIVPHVSPVTTSYHLLQVVIVPVCVGSLGAERALVCGEAFVVEETQAAFVVPTQ